MSATLIPAAVSVGTVIPTEAHLSLFPRRADELRSFLFDLPATRSVVLPSTRDICNIAFRLVNKNKSIVIFSSANGCGYHEAAVHAGPCIALRRPTEDEAEAMALLGQPPVSSSNLRVLEELSAMIRNHGASSRRTLHSLYASPLSPSLTIVVRCWTATSSSDAEAAVLSSPAPHPPPHVCSAYHRAAQGCLSSHRVSFATRKSEARVATDEASAFPLCEAAHLGKASWRTHCSSHHLFTRQRRLILKHPRV
jgi:hypothetical protein